MNRKKQDAEHEAIDRPSGTKTPGQGVGDAQDRNEVKKRKRRAPRRRKPSGSETATASPEQKTGEAWLPESFVVPAMEGRIRFHDFPLSPEIMHALMDLDFKYCMPIQSAILQHLLDGRDAAGQAQTGTGKTLAFLIGIFTRLQREGSGKDRPVGSPRALVVAPTRELAIQIDKDAQDLGKYLPFRTLALYGGLDYKKQAQTLSESRVDLVVATPGRLLDYLGRGIVRLKDVEVLVLDEADRMMDMGFMPDVRRIVNATPPKDRRQTMLFSATLDQAIMQRAASWLTNPARIEIEPERRAAESVDQKVFIVTTEMKFNLLYHILTQEKPPRAIIYANRRTTVERLHYSLCSLGFSCCTLSGAVSQEKRLRTLQRFREGSASLMVATDVAGRGLHIEGVTHIFNFNVPLDAEDYVHRIGRTGRAGALGTSITFACEEESFYLPAIEEYLGHELKYTHPEEAWLEPPPGAATMARQERDPRGRRRQGPPPASRRSRPQGGRRSPR